MVSDLLRQQELGEFLSSTENYKIKDLELKTDFDTFMRSVEGWNSKKYLTPYDSVSFYSDLYVSRSLFLDINKIKYTCYSDEKYYKDHIKVSLSYAKG